MGKIYTRFQTEMVQKSYPLGWYIPYMAFVREYPPGVGRWAFPSKKSLYGYIWRLCRLAPCGMLVLRRSSEVHYTSLMTKCRSRVLPTANF